MYNFDDILDYGDDPSLYFEFFTQELYWPIALPNFEFLFDRFDSIGREIFSEQWTGYEKLEQHLPELKDDSFYHGRSHEAAYARYIIKEAGQKPLSPPSRSSWLSSELAAEDWDLARTIYKEKYSDGLRQAKDRFRKTMLHMRSLLVNGELTAYSRHFKGLGALLPVPAESWTSYISYRFFYYGMFWSDDPARSTNLHMPPALHRYDSVKDAENLHFIFIKKSETKPPKSPIKKTKTNLGITELEAEVEAILIGLLNKGEELNRDKFVEHCRMLGYATTRSKAVYSRYINGLSLKR